MSLPIRPIGRRVLVRLTDTDHRHGSLYLPENRETGHRDAVVIAVAEDCKDGLQPGDRVAISRWMGCDRVYRGENLSLVKEEWVLGVYESDGGAA